MRSPSEYFAWDCHAHVIEPTRFPLWPGRGYEPPAAPLASYLDLLGRYGFDRGVLVQPSVYGFDNSCLLDALQRADGRLLGIVVPAPDAHAQQFATWHRQGVRGVRCNRLNPGGLELATLVEWQPVLRDLGWHVQLHIDVEATNLQEFIEQLDVPVVVDHMGRPAPGRADPALPALQQLISFVRAGECYVKLSAPYRLSADGAPWPEVTALARALLDANAARCLWGSDWPFTQMTGVETAAIFATAERWFSDDNERRAVLATTPASLFDFPA